MKPNIVLSDAYVAQHHIPKRKKKEEKFRSSLLMQMNLEENTERRSAHAKDAAPRINLPPPKSRDTI